MLTKIIHAKADNAQYDIVIGRPLAQFPAEFARLAPKGTRVAIIADGNVVKRYGHPLERALKHAGYEVHLLIVPPGEKSKTVRQTERIHRFCARAFLERKSWLIALGGGVVGDIAGFAAATYLRGIPFIQIPTTLLAQVDSSIGGKTGVDIPEGKNLVGAFHQPRLVWIDPTTLRTLPKAHLRNGMAEVIKYGAILDAKLFATLEHSAEDLLKGYSPAWTPIIARCVQLKAGVVEEDTFETKGRRALLNFGHSLGHAIEAATGYTRYLHGEAIAIGMFAAAIIGQQQDQTDQLDRIRLGTLLSKAGLPIRARAAIPRAELMTYLARDKKAADGSTRFVLLEKIGRAVSGQSVSPEVLEVTLTTVGL